ncbi:cholesterol 24-hydroxylase-like isoform X1 [Oculina patagonica]
MLNLILCVAGTLVVLSLVLLLSFALYLSNTRRKFAHIPSPPMTSFFKGHADEITAMRHKGYPTDHKFLEWHIEYGKILVVWFWHFPLLVVTDSEIVKDIHIVKNLPKEAFSYEVLARLYGQRFLGQGLVTNLDHESWKKRRGILNPAFHRKSLKDLMSSFNSTADLLLNHLSTMADGKTEVCMFDQFARAALDVICKVAFGMDIDIINAKDTKFTEAVSLSFHGVEEASFDLFHKFKVNQYPFQRSVTKAIQFLRETGRKVIEVRKNAMKRGEQVPDDILQRIIQQQEEMPDLGLEDLLDDFVTFFIAGHETTSSLLAFCVLELGDHPEIEESLVGEVFDVLGEKQNVAFDDLAKLHQLGLVIKETLRRHPPATGLIRKVAKDQEIGGYKIPADVAVLVQCFGYCLLLSVFNSSSTRLSPFNKRKSKWEGAFRDALARKVCLGVRSREIKVSPRLARISSRARLLLKAMFHEAIFLTTCNATMTTGKHCKLQRGCHAVGGVTPLGMSRHWGCHAVGGVTPLGVSRRWGCHAVGGVTCKK